MKKTVVLVLIFLFLPAIICAKNKNITVNQGTKRVITAGQKNRPEKEAITDQQLKQDIRNCISNLILEQTMTPRGKKKPVIMHFLLNQQTALAEIKKLLQDQRLNDFPHNRDILRGLGRMLLILEQACKAKGPTKSMSDNTVKMYCRYLQEEQARVFADMKLRHRIAEFKPFEQLLQAIENAVMTVLLDGNKRLKDDYWMEVMKTSGRINNYDHKLFGLVKS